MIQILVLECLNPNRDSTQVPEGLSTSLNCIPSLSVLERLDPSLEFDNGSVGIGEVLFKPDYQSA
jgi:hypothetical protein